MYKYAYAMPVAAGIPGRAWVSGPEEGLPAILLWHRLAGPKRACLVGAHIMAIPEMPSLIQVPLGSEVACARLEWPYFLCVPLKL